MSELVTGGEIFDALSVLADNPEYLAEILDGHDGTDAPSCPSSWAGPPAARAGEDTGGGCCCGRGTAVSDCGGGVVYGTGAKRCAGGVACGGVLQQRGVFVDHQGLNNINNNNTSTCGGGAGSGSSGHTHNNNNNMLSMNHPQNAHHHSASLPPLSLPSGITPSSSATSVNTAIPTFPSSWADPGTLSTLESDHGLMYRADFSYYSASGSESGGDSSCSPGYDVTAAPPMDWSMLKDLTNTLNMKQEAMPLETCVYSTCNDSTSSSTTNGHAFVNNDLDNARLEEVSGGGVTLLRPDAGRLLPQGTDPVQYTDSTPPHPGSPQYSPQYADSPQYPDSPQDDDYSVASDGESSPVTGVQSKINGLKPDRRLRRREQNRQAARRCRQRKKEQSQELVKEYYQLLSANSEMQSKLKLLESEKQRLKDIYEAHLATCTVHLSAASCT